MNPIETFCLNTMNAGGHYDAHQLAREYNRTTKSAVDWHEFSSALSHLQMAGRIFICGHNADGMVIYSDQRATRPLFEIAHDILRDWNPVSYNAVPYLQAMRHLDTIYDQYGVEDAKSVVRYFLSNAHGWRGETARAIKAELKAMVEPTLILKNGAYHE